MRQRLPGIETVRMTGIASIHVDGHEHVLADGNGEAIVARTIDAEAVPVGEATGLWGSGDAEPRKPTGRCSFGHDRENADPLAVDRRRVDVDTERHRVNGAREPGLSCGVDRGARGGDLRGAGNGHKAELHTNRAG